VNGNATETTVGVLPLSPEPNLHRAWSLGIGGAVTVAVALGLFGRLYGLGNFPLAVDEYYHIQSVKGILNYGVPWLDAGGYYTRGLILQYLTAASILLFGDGEFAYRLPSSLFSLGAIPLAYVYASRRVGPAGGLALAAMLSISAWEIEFGRFARMYSALQFFTLLFFVAIDKASDARNRRWLYAPHLIVLTTSLVHEFAILLIPFLAVPLISTNAAPSLSRHARLRVAFIAVTAITALACYYYIFSFDIGNVGVTDPFPADLESSPAPPWQPRDSPWLWPVMPFFSPAIAETVLLAGLGLAIATVLGLIGLRLAGKKAEESTVAGNLLLVSVVLHQFLIAAAILLFMVARYRLFDLTREKRGIYARVVLAAGVAAFWLVFALESRDWVASTFRPEYGSSPNYPLTKALIRVFFGWPIIIDYFVLPWLNDLPLIGACAAVAGVYQVVTKADRDLASLARNPVAIIAVAVLAFGVRSSPYSSIRYSFFLYPFALTLILLSATESAAVILRRRGKNERLGHMVAICACVTMFLASSDFHLRQITDVAGPVVRLRLGQFAPYEGIWYFRWDYESPALFINERSGFRDGDKAIVVEQPPASFYLRVPHASYYPRTSNLAWDHSRAQGTVDRWSNQPLLGTTQALREYTSCAPNVWIIRTVSSTNRPFEVEDVWGDRLVRASDVFHGVDGRLAVIRVELAPGSGC
jgi:hypothetical protein